MHIHGKVSWTTHCLWIVTVAAITLVGGCSSGSTGVIRDEFALDQRGRLLYTRSPDGARVKFTYDDRDLPTRVDYRREAIQYWYDAGKNLIAAEDPSGTTQYFYDAFDQLIGVISWHSPWSLITYGYDPWGRKSHQSIFDLDEMSEHPDYMDLLRKLEWQVWQEQPDVHRRDELFQQLCDKLRHATPEQRQQWSNYDAGFSHDAFGELTSVDTQWGTIKYNYDPEAGRIRRELPNGIVSTYDYSPSGRLESLRHQRAAGELIVEYRYHYDPQKRNDLVQEIAPGVTKTYGYQWDDRNRLTQYQDPAGGITKYSYDDHGRRQESWNDAGRTTYEYDASGRLSVAGGTRYGWGRNGNLATIRQGRERTRIRYDQRGYPTLVRTPEGSTHYDWDWSGNLVSKRRGDGATHYLPDPVAPGHTLVEFEENGHRAMTYIHGRELAGQGTPRGNAEFFLEDGFGSIRMTTDQRGQIVARHNYDPFGQPRDARPYVAPKFRSAGERFDPELNAYVSPQRLRNPSIGSDISKPRPMSPGRFGSDRPRAPAPAPRPSRWQNADLVQVAAEQVLDDLQSALEDADLYNLPFSLSTRVHKYDDV